MTKKYEQTADNPSWHDIVRLGLRAADCENPNQSLFLVLKAAANSNWSPDACCWFVKYLLASSLGGERAAAILRHPDFKLGVLARGWRQLVAMDMETVHQGAVHGVMFDKCIQVFWDHQNTTDATDMINSVCLRVTSYHRPYGPSLHGCSRLIDWLHAENFRPLALTLSATSLMSAMANAVRGPARQRYIDARTELSWHATDAALRRRSRH